MQPSLARTLSEKCKHRRGRRSNAGFRGVVKTSLTRDTCPSVRRGAFASDPARRLASPAGAGWHTADSTTGDPWLTGSRCRVKGEAPRHRSCGHERCTLVSPERPRADGPRFLTLDPGDFRTNPSVLLRGCSLVMMLWLSGSPWVGRLDLTHSYPEKDSCPTTS